MTEPSNEPAQPGQDPAQQPPQQQAGDPPQQSQQDEPLGEGGLRALQAEREARKAAEKAAAEAAERIKEFEDRDKSELQRLTEAHQAAQAEAEQARREALRYRVAVRHGISDEDAEVFLTGSDEEAITRQAERLAELRGSQQQPPPTTTHRPTERLRTGSDPTKPVEETDPRKLAANVPRY